MDSLWPDFVCHDGAPSVLRAILTAPLIHWSELAEAGDGLGALEQHRSAEFESCETLPDLDDSWECYTVVRLFLEANFAGTARDQHLGMAALGEFEGPEQKRSVEIIDWNRPYLLETDHYEHATGELAAVIADLAWKMKMVVAGSLRSGSDVAKEASLRSAPTSEQ